MWMCINIIGDFSIHVWDNIGVNFIKFKIVRLVTRRFRKHFRVHIAVRSHFVNHTHFQQWYHREARLIKILWLHSIDFRNINNIWDLQSVHSMFGSLQVYSFKGRWPKFGCSRFTEYIGTASKQPYIIEWWFLGRKCVVRSFLNWRLKRLVENVNYVFEYKRPQTYLKLRLDDQGTLIFYHGTIDALRNVIVIFYIRW